MKLINKILNLIRYNDNKELIIKLLITCLLMLIWFFIGIFKVNASSLNYADFDYYVVNAEHDNTMRLCETIISNQLQSGVSCTYTFTNNEWNKFIEHDDTNIILWPILHSAYMSTNTYNNGSMTLVNTQLVDYTKKAYLKDVHNQIYNCDFINDNGAFCRFNRDNKITSITLELSFSDTWNNVTTSTILNTRLYFQSQFYITSYSGIGNSLNDIKKSLTDSSVDTNNIGSSSGSWDSKNTSDNTITNLVALPISLVSAYANGMRGTCSPFSLGELFGENITLPCINVADYIGASLWGVIDVLFSGFMIYAISKKLVKIFNDITNLKDNQVDELYGGGA